MKSFIRPYFFAMANARVFALSVILIMAVVIVSIVLYLHGIPSDKLVSEKSIDNMRYAVFQHYDGLGNFYSSSLLVEDVTGVQKRFYLGHEEGYWWTGQIDRLTPTIVLITKNGSPVSLFDVSTSVTITFDDLASRGVAG